MIQMEGTSMIKRNRRTVLLFMGRLEDCLYPTEVGHLEDLRRTI